MEFEDEVKEESGRVYISMCVSLQVLSNNTQGFCPLGWVAG